MSPEEKKYLIQRFVRWVQEADEEAIEQFIVNISTQARREAMVAAIKAQIVSEKQAQVADLDAAKTRIQSEITELGG